MTIFWIMYALSVMLLGCFFCVLWSYAESMRGNPRLHFPKKSLTERIVGRIKMLIFILFPVLNTLFAILIFLNWNRVIEASMDRIIKELE